jgi:hypothetical protein
MVYDPSTDGLGDGPSAAELAAIETEWPLIEAELALVDAEIRVLSAERPSELDWRRLRRAEHRVIREMAALVAVSPAYVRESLAA